MARSEHTALDVRTRPVEGSRATRRLRREGLVPGVVYGGGGGALTFAVDARTLRAALAHAGAVLDLTLDGGSTIPVIVKDVQNPPLRGEALHLDLLRVDMNQPIHSTVVLELTGTEEAPGVAEGGVLSQETRELNIEALPDDIPDAITYDVSSLEMNGTVTLSAIAPPNGVTLLDDLEETVIATITPPSQEPAEDEIETETELVGEDGEPTGAAAGGRGRRADRGRGRGRGGPAPGRGRHRRRGCAGLRRRQLKLLRSTPVDWLVVGLGNPGSRYANPPHNIGFSVADTLIERWDLPRPKKKFNGELTEGRTGPGGPRVAVLKPQTYMNDAGRSAGPARGAYRLDLDRVLVIHDEIDLPFGDIRG